MKKLILFFLCIACIIITGCTSVATVYEFADDGVTVKKKIVTEETMVKSIMEEMKDKNVAWGVSGWRGTVQATFFDSETYLPTAKIDIFNMNKWHISFTKETDPAPTIEALQNGGVEGVAKPHEIRIGNK